MDFEKRVANLGKAFCGDRHDALLITGSENVFYLTGFTGSFSLLLLVVNKLYLFVDGRYYEKAKKSSHNCEVILFENLFATLGEYLTRLRVEKLFFESETMTFSFYREFKKKIKNVKIMPLRNSIMPELRMVKDRDEIRLLRQATEKSREIYSRFSKQHVREGAKERYLAAKLEFMMKEEADGISFDTIVASGKNASIPHAVPTEKKLNSKDMVIIDYGLKWKGYCTDHTRTVILGANKMEKYYNIVLEAIKVGLKFVKPGNAVKLVDENIRAFFKEQGILDKFLHSSGHGIGLNVHEKPSLSYKACEVFKEGMVLTIEPGLYFEGIGGIRVEEMFLVTKKGYEIL